jgi:tetrahydromethanopterin S-methyltransferase subunit G
MTPEEYPVEHSFDIQAILIREDLITELKRRVAELEEKNADLEARLGHEQVVTMQDRETQLQKHIQELEKKVEFWSGVAMKYAPDEEVMEG